MCVLAQHRDRRVAGLCVPHHQRPRPSQRRGLRLRGRHGISGKVLLRVRRCEQPGWLCYDALYKRDHELAEVHRHEMLADHWATIDSDTLYGRFVSST